MSEDTPVIILFKSAHPALYTAHRRYPGSQLGPGFLAAHRMTHLVLLHSCPDTVHEVLLRKTQTSTPLTRGSPASSHPRRDITSAGADCRYRAPLSPRLRGLSYYIVNPLFCQVLLRILPHQPPSSTMRLIHLPAPSSTFCGRWISSPPLPFRQL